MLGGLRGKDELVNLAVNIKRQQRLKHLLSAGLEKHLAIVSGCDGGDASVRLRVDDKIPEVFKRQNPVVILLPAFHLAP